MIQNFEPSLNRNQTGSLRPHVLGVMLLSMLVWLLHSIALPIADGRDMGTYFLYYRDFFRVYPEFPQCQMFRTPVTPFFFGILFDLFGPIGVGSVLWLSYVGILCLIFIIGASIRLWLGYTTWLFVAMDISHYEWFNRVGSESPQSIMLVLWIAFAFFTFYSVKKRVWILHAFLIFLMVMTRPGNQVAALALLIPLLNIRRQWQEKIRLTGIAIIVYLIFISAYCTYNYVRYDDFSVARFGDAHLPFYRVFIQDRLIRPENGPASAELARIFDEHLATNKMLLDYQINRESFFSMATGRMFSALVLAINDHYGWNNHYTLLRNAGWEAAKTYPLQFWLGYIDQVRDVFFCRGPLYFRPPSPIDVPFEVIRNRYYAAWKAKGLPLPTEGEMLPSTFGATFLTAKPSNYPNSDANIFGIRHAAQKWDTNSAQLWSVSSPLITRFYQNLQTIRFPFIAVFVLLGLGRLFILACIRGPLADLRIPVLFVIQIANLMATLMASVQIQFRYPFDPLFILFGCEALLSITDKWCKRIGHSKLNINPVAK